MNLIDYFNPAPKIKSTQGVLSYQDVLASQVCSKYTSESLEQCDVAIIGVEDGINSPNNKGVEDSPNAIRWCLYRLARTSRDLRVVDLGNVKGINVQDRYHAIKDVFNILSAYNLTIILLGGSQDYILPFCNELIKEEVLNLSLIDNKIDYSFDSNAVTSEAMISRLDIDDKSNVNVIGAQRYFFSDSQIEEFNSRNWSIYRLKDLAGDRVCDIEPILRDSNIICFDAEAIECGVMPTYNYANVNGFSAVDACKLAWYSGLSSRIKVFGLTEFNSQVDGKEKGAMLYAQLAWHFLEALSLNSREVPSIHSNEFNIFTVHIHEIGIDVRFYKSILTERWWVELPHVTGVRLFACNEKEYKNSLLGELPQKWLGVRGLDLFYNDK